MNDCLILSYLEDMLQEKSKHLIEELEEEVRNLRLLLCAILTVNDDKVIIPDKVLQSIDVGRLKIIRIYKEETKETFLGLMRKNK